jgi:hypothetical protein
MELKTIFQSKISRGILYGVAIFLLLLTVFQAGVFVGVKKASFSGQYGDNYFRNFAQPRQEFMREFEGKNLTGGHGVFGAILKIDGQNIIIKGPNNLEKIIVTDEKTQIMNMQNPVKITELKTDDNLVVIGSPNESGQIEAKLIRMLPAPPEEFTQGLLPPPEMMESQTQPLSQTLQ